MSRQNHFSRTLRLCRERSRGLTLLELLVALFIFMVGVLGVMMAIPAGANSASWVVFQDAAIHLAQSKFSEFRRDRVNPEVDLFDGSSYLGGSGTLANGRAAGKQEPLASGWRGFAHATPDDTYFYFDDIERYEWKIDQTTRRTIGAGAGSAPVGFQAPQYNGGDLIGLTQVTVVVRLKNTSKEFRFTQYMTAYDD